MVRSGSRLAGAAIRKSLDLTSWTAASALIHEAEAVSSRDPILLKLGEAEPPEESEPSITVREALEKFIQECRARGINERTLKKYQYLERALRAYTDNLGLARLSDITLVTLRDFRSSWKLGPRTSLRTLERLKSFFGFCQENDWIAKSPAQALKPPEIKPKATEPYTDEQFQKILAACEGKPRHRTLVLVLRYTGLRISDAVCLRRDAVRSGEVRLYAQKNGVGVCCPIPPQVVSALETCPNSSNQ